MCETKLQYARRRKRKANNWYWLCATLIYASTIDGMEISCPSECRCSMGRDTEGSGALRVVCSAGAMHTVPVDALDRTAHTIIISPPPEKPNVLTIGPIFTQPIPFTNLRELHITHSNVPSIGQYSFWGLQNLRSLNLTHNNLTFVVQDNFRGLINLTELHLDYNHIDQMASETFRHLIALRTLTLSNNQITTLVTRLFRMLANLVYLDLSDNPLEDLNSEVFKDIQHLRIFKCRRCRLKRINTQIYHFVSHLEELDLGENEFKYLASDEFISLNRLRRLKLDGNQLPVIVNNSFGHQRELRLLSLARNRLALLAPAALANLTSLTHLDISHNKMSKLHVQTFSPLVDTIKTINFGGNNLALSEIGIVLQILPNIQGIGMSNLSIEQLPIHYFSFNDRLVALDLSWNKFKEFPYKLLTKTRFLQHLDISHNQIQSLEERDLERLEAIGHINLMKNAWRCDQCATGAMLMYMSISVLNASIRHLKCHSPYKLRGVMFGDLTYDRLESCPSVQETQMSMIAGLMLLCVAVLAAVAAALCCRRRTAHYYTNEEKRRERQHDHPEELLGRTDLGSVATIHAPYHLVSKNP